jgi:glycosyltransferase involved in cell wall biosynthesis
MRHMRIGIDASRAARSHQTGTEVYSLHLIRALIESRQREEIILYSPTNLPREVWNDPPVSADEATSEAGIQGLARRWCTLRILPFPRLWTHLRLNRELRRDPPDLLFVPSHVIPIRCPVPAVVTVHDLGYLYYPEAHRPFDRWYLDWTTRRHARGAARVIADSEATRADLLEHYGADPSRVEVIYPGRDEAMQRVGDLTVLAEVKARYGINGDYLLYLGTLQPRKNLMRLVSAFAQIQPTIQRQNRERERTHATDAPLYLVLAGHKGWHHGALVRRVNALGLRSRVLFPGYVAHEDKAALISGALALVFPSLYEGFGIPVLEAMACGVPVLTSNVSSLPEVAGDAALLVDPLSEDDIAAGMASLVENQDVQRMLIERGYAQVQRFSWQRAADQLWEVFDSIAR